MILQCGGFGGGGVFTAFAMQTVSHSGLACCHYAIKILKNSQEEAGVGKRAGIINRIASRAER